MTKSERRVAEIKAAAKAAYDSCNLSDIGNCKLPAVLVIGYAMDNGTVRTVRNALPCNPLAIIEHIYISAHFNGGHKVTSVNASVEVQR